MPAMMPTMPAAPPPAAPPPAAPPPAAPPPADSPWSLSFSFGRALQDAVLKAWAGDERNVAVAQELMCDIARVNAEAQLGVWNEEHPSPGPGRLNLPKLSYSSERREATARDLFNW